MSQKQAFIPFIFLHKRPLRTGGSAAVVEANSNNNEPRHQPGFSLILIRILEGSIRGYHSQ